MTSKIPSKKRTTPTTNTVVNTKEKTKPIIDGDMLDVEEDDIKEYIEVSKPITPTASKRLKLTEVSASFDNTTLFEPLSSTFVKTSQLPSEETKEQPGAVIMPLPGTTPVTALVVWKPPPPPRVMTVLDDQTTIIFKTRLLWFENHRAMIMKQIAQERTVSENNKIMLSDIKKGQFKYWKWIPSSSVEFYPYKFEAGSFGTIREMRCRCSTLQTCEELTVETSLLPCQFGQLAPLGNFHPNALAGRPASLLNAKNTIQATFKSQPMQPGLSRDAYDNKIWYLDIYNRGMQFSLYCPECPAYIQLVLDGHNPTGTDEEKKRYEAAFWYHARGPWKDDKGGKYPDCFTAKAKAFKKCSVKRAVEYPKDPYKVPGNLEIIDFFHRKTLPPYDKKELAKPEEKRIRCRYEHVDVPIYDPQGKIIWLEDRPELKAYKDKDQTEFIDCNERSSIVNREWDSLTVQFTFTYKPKSKDSDWSYGIHVELVDVNKHLPPDPYDEVEPIPAKEKATEENTPQGRLLMSNDDAQKLIDEALEQEMMSYDLDQATKTSTPKSITTTSTDTTKVD